MNWRLIIFSAVGAAVGINLLTVLAIALLYFSGIFPDRSVAGLEDYIFLFAVFSPLVASFVSSAFVTYFSRSKKIPHVIVSTLITFSLAAVVLIFFTSFCARTLYADYYQRVNKTEKKAQEQ